jgi:Endonuclease NucS C-terminal domain
VANFDSEKKLEDYLFAHPEALQDDFGFRHVDHWLKRQYRVPSGIIDLVGVAPGSNQLWVVEIKNRPIKTDALTQVCRYAFDIEQICKACQGQLEGTYQRRFPAFYPIAKMVIAPHFTPDLWDEAEALGITVVTFEIEGEQPVFNKDGSTHEYTICREPAWNALAPDFAETVKANITVQMRLQRKIKRRCDHVPF